MKPEVSKIRGLWQRFYDVIAPNLMNGATIFGVYHNYESDASGEFSVLAGADQINVSSSCSTDKVLIQSGNYLLFEAKGDMPQVVIDTWSKVWEYFESGGSEYQRAYTTDFELYKSQNEIEVYIAIK
jgi:predicted transcriptional regulator YdeE